MESEVEGWKREGKEENEEKDLLPTGLLPKCSQQSVKGQEFNPGMPWQKLTTGAIITALWARHEQEPGITSWIQANWPTICNF